MAIQIQESFVNLTKGIRYSDTEWYTPYTDNRGQLYRSLVREYGRCTSKVYIDKTDGPPEAIGWTFVKRVEYDDADRIRNKAERTYLREVWVALRNVPDEEC
jgi:hypothetical protein